MIFYWPEMQPFNEYFKPREKRYFKLPSGGTLAAEIWGHDQLKVLEVISTDLSDYMNSQIQPGSLLSLQPQVQTEDVASSDTGSGTGSKP